MTDASASDSQRQGGLSLDGVAQGNFEGVAHGKDAEGAAPSDLPVTGTSIASPDASFDLLLRNMAATGGLPTARLPALGEVVAGKYRIEEQLGGGGMGAVFRATHLVNEKQVAIKWMLRPASDEHARRRFVREARAAARIEHPNVVDVYDAGQQGELGLYMVMQLLRGETLGARIKRGRLRVDEAIELLVPAMRGVLAVHQAGVIHRDLKPDNIFLCEDRHTGICYAKVLDFGISAMVACDPKDPTLTRDGAVLGTPAYMSPEQLRDSRSVDVRTDVYAFGVILYEALTGAMPFAADSYNGLILEIVNGTPKRPRELRPELPAEIEQVVLRALAKRSEDRYPSIDALIGALLPFRGLQASSLEHGAREAVRSYPAGRSRWLPAPRWLWLMAAVLGTVLIAALRIGRSPRVDTAEPAAASPSAPPPPSLPIALPPERQNATPPSVSPPRASIPSEPLPLTAKKMKRDAEGSLVRERTQHSKAARPPRSRARSGTISADEL